MRDGVIRYYDASLLATIFSAPNRERLVISDREILQIEPQGANIYWSSEVERYINRRVDAWIED